MPQFATAYSAAPNATRPASSVADALAIVTQAGETIADLRARLARAERAIAVLEEEKRAVQAELRALRHGARATATSAEVSPNRSHLDEALAALVEGLGPSLVRVGP